MGFPKQGFPSQGFPVWCEEVLSGHNKIDMSLIQCLNLQSVDNTGYVGGREKVDKLVFF